ncbi:thiamine pyrophosphate-dependent dehydrogenase E1 component subunit alpha [Nocardioides guangzhouensis]|uniref:Thiamine pyrophosphate-dependent dehydrogenase E1 component subunit alpha n=1 Tax=Nocardioides guangzhouensis TaxID=2497878 RepID=A0A4Q4ZF16_9ACTN|nr:thiamine pyrophosphate-dependent dehydrogenase E1 component subunit alpha [Nocardioides guangzhouensis]RYP86255.1 thiamine pyrophosphate-dependent dehydrogenase E1 component subunit alpha [Nocardioides guangzhouensis]
MADQPDLEQLYLQMCRVRLAEEAIAGLWRDGRISGEMHLGAGEEGAVVGVLAHLEPGDRLSVDYRSTPPFVARGVPVDAIVRELLGDPDGLDGGSAGHMHLLSREHLVASTGIVGAPAPVACGFALSAQQEHRRRVAFAFFGDGAVNEGMVMESLNLAAVWRLPVVFVCKDNRWAVTTRSRDVLGGGLVRRARGLGLRAVRVDGRDAVAVWRAAGRAVRRARRGGGPTFLIARVDRLEGHFLGDPLVRVANDARVLRSETAPLLEAVRHPDGAALASRLRAVLGVGRTIAAARLDGLHRRRDPLDLLRSRLPADVAAAVEQSARDEIRAAVAAATEEATRA